MAAVIGALRADLSANTAQFEQGMNSAASTVDAFRARLGAIGGVMQRTGAIMSAALTAPLVLFGKNALNAFQESENAVAAVNAALSTMGDSAGFTSDELQAMAAQLQALTTFDDDEILSKVTANLLTFGQVAGEEFARAQAAALDLSARLGQDLQSSAIMVGKALNDPIAGLTSLRRVGIQFTDDQEAVIASLVETGQVAEAQRVILAELERQFGQQAEAAAGTTAGQVAQLTNAWGDFKEQIGEVIAQFLPPLVEMLSGVVAFLQDLDAETLEWIVTIGGIAAALGPVLAILGTLVIAIGALISPIGLVVVAVTGLIAVWVAFRDDITAIVESIPQIITDAFEGVVAYLEGWVDTIVQSFVDMKDRVLGIVGDMVAGVGDWITNQLPQVASVVPVIGPIIQGFQQLYDEVVGNSIVPDLVNEVGDWFGRLGDAMVRPTQQAAVEAQGAFAGLADTIGTGLADAFDRAIFKGEDLLDVLGNLLNKLADVVANQAFDLLGGVISGGINALFGGGGNGLPGGINDVIGAVLGRAGGGGVNAGMPYITGERGPELFLPRVSGQIVPNDMLRGIVGAEDRGGSPSMSIVINAPGADAAALRRVEMAVTDLNRTFNDRAAGAVQRARSRNPGLFSER